MAHPHTQPKTGATACVDPAEPEKLLAAAKKEGLSISTVCVGRWKEG